jgi:tetratricopeptide (TPR) repeat protein
MAEVGRDLLGSFCADLRMLWVEAGGPSLRALERHLSLSKSQVGAILNGGIRRPPDWRVVRTLVECVHRHAVEHGRADRLSVRIGVEEYWRPRFALLEHAFETVGPQVRMAEDPVAPALLPPAVAGFVGRRDLLAVLDDLLATRAKLSPAVLITAVGGTAGVGKTALAVHWAHRVAHAFPDGQLYVNLRGFDPGGSALGPSEAVRVFLNALSVPAERIPAGLTARAGLYRSLLAGRRMLIVLDNARDVDQVRPLLPGGVGSMVVVTSRNRLTPLVATEGARSVTLNLLADEEARELLARRLGRSLTAAEDEAVEEIIARCARLPLALAVVAARAATNPSLPLSLLAAELQDRTGALDTLQGGDPATDVRTAFSWSYRRLPPEAARLFRLLGLHPSADFAAAAAVSLAGDSPALTRAGLAELTRVHLVTERSPGRYEFHDLLRAYAGEQVAAVGGADRERAMHRMLDHYVHTAHRASVLMDPHRYVGSAPEEVEPGVTPEEPGDADRALAWFTIEHRTLLAAIGQADDAGFPRHTWQLARAMTNYLYRQGHWHDLTVSHRTALASAERAADLAGQAHAWRGIAAAHWLHDQLREARTAMETALELFRQVADHDGMGVMHENLGSVTWRLGSPDQALAHARQSLELHRSTGRQAGQARALGTIAWMLARLGDPAQAIRHCGQALAVQLRLDDTSGLAVTWHSLGHAHATAHDYEEAACCYQRSVELFRVTGHLADQASTLDDLGDAHHCAGHPHAAQTAWHEAITIYDELAHPDTARIRTKLHAHAQQSPTP